MRRLPRLKQKIKYYKKIFYNRLSSLKRILVVFLLIAITVIIGVDFYLIDLLSNNKVFSQILDFTTQLSYAYLSAFIFYFLVVHLPEENRKVRAYRPLNNKILTIHRELQEINFLVLDATNYKHREQKHQFSITDLSFEEYHEYAKQTNPQYPPKLAFHKQPFSNWFEFLNYKSTKIKKLIEDLLLLNTILDGDVLRLLLYIEDEMGKVYFDSRLGNTTLESFSLALYKASFDCEDLIQTFFKRYKRYVYEDGYFYKKQRFKMENGKLR